MAFYTQTDCEIAAVAALNNISVGQLFGVSVNLADNYKPYLLCSLLSCINYAQSSALSTKTNAVRPPDHSLSIRSFI